MINLFERFCYVLRPADVCALDEVIVTPGVIWMREDPVSYPRVDQSNAEIARYYLLEVHQSSEPEAELFRNIRILVVVDDGQDLIHALKAFCQSHAVQEAGVRESRQGLGDVVVLIPFQDHGVADMFIHVKLPDPEFAITCFLLHRLEVQAVNRAKVAGVHCV